MRRGRVPVAVNKRWRRGFATADLLADAMLGVGSANAEKCGCFFPQESK